MQRTNTQTQNNEQDLRKAKILFFVLAALLITAGFIFEIAQNGLSNL